MRKVKAMIHSLEALDEVTIFPYTDNNHVVAEYKGKKYSAIFNPFSCLFYVDDVYGLLEGKE